MIDTKIDDLLKRLKKKNLLTPRVNLYSESLKSKLLQARWSLDLLRKIEHIPNIVGQATSQEPWDRTSTNEKIYFFCECFWDFLRSSIEFVAQLINELRSLSINEDDVSFSIVRDRMKPTMSTTLLFKSMHSLERSWAFKTLNSYRHCSTHRRQVCIFELPATPAPTTSAYSLILGGSTTGEMNRYLCKNPYKIQPRPDLKKPIVTYNEEIIKEIERRLSTILNRLP
jgi:hypothetical protein